jgi:hypothetical protein
VLVAFGLVIAFKLYVSTRQKLDKTNANLEHPDAVAGQLYRSMCLMRKEPSE